MNDPRSTIRFRGQIAYGDGYGDTAELPFFKNYYAGGVDSVRGFRARGLGPVDSVTGDPIGGNKLLTANAEYIFPVPGSPEQGSSMRLSMFFDAGMVYGSNQSIDPSQVRFSSGIAFNWFTPMFPIAISLGFPLNAQPGDLTETFQFSIGLPLQ
jgi:outer membrane protein insertion porin family